MKATTKTQSTSQLFLEINTRTSSRPRADLCPLDKIHYNFLQQKTICFGWVDWGLLFTVGIRGDEIGKCVFSGVICGKDFWYFRLAVDMSSVKISVVLIKMPQVLSGLWVTLGVVLWRLGTIL